MDRSSSICPIHALPLRSMLSVKIDQFKARLTEKDRIILQMRSEEHPLQEIADAVGYKTASAVKKRIDKIAAEYTDFVSSEYSDFLATHIK